MSVNGRVRPDWVVVDVKTGREERIPGGTYYLDWTEPDGGKGRDGKGKRMRVAVGTSAVTAQNARLRKEAELKALARGIALVPSEDGAKRSLPPAVEDFLEQVRLTRKEKTHEGYRIALGYFQESCSKRYLEDIEKLDLLKFMAFLRDEKKQSPRSVSNKFACVNGMQVRPD
jgi:Site-specific recombinase XerD